MVMNQVQFRAGLSIAQFIRQYRTEAKCYRALYRACWPRGFRCPECGRRVMWLFVYHIVNDLVMWALP